jgi:O-antigen ligase
MPRAPSPPASPEAAPRRGWSFGLLVVWLTMLVPPFLLDLRAKESFRLPKLMASEWLALASLLLLAGQMRKVGEVRLADLWRRPAVRALLPLLLVATLGLLTTAHPLHVREGLIDLWIGAAALVGWSLALPEPRQEELLRGLLWPAAGLALFGILQFHGLFQPLDLVGVGYDKRLAVTSTAGNPGDLGAYLVLPCLIAQWILARGRSVGSSAESSRRARWGAVLFLIIGLYALALTQTLAALAALVVGSLFLWAGVLPGRRVAMVLGGGVALALVLVLAVAPLRMRVTAKASQALQGDWNSVLTGRLDGWRAAVWMLREHPWAGVGHGAFRPEFVPAKLALLDRGVQFYAEQMQPVFANAHNEYLEAGADLGIPGLLALGWGLWVLVAAVRGRCRGSKRGSQHALAAAGVAALAVLALAAFPFRIALVGYPALLFLAWVLRPRADEEGEATL